MPDYSSQVSAHVMTRQQRIEKATAEFIQRRGVDFAKGQWRDLHDELNISAQELADELCRDVNWEQRKYDIAEHHGKSMAHYPPKLQLRFKIENLHSSGEPIDRWYIDTDKGIGF